MYQHVASTDDESERNFVFRLFELAPRRGFKHWPQENVTEKCLDWAQ